MQDWIGISHHRKCFNGIVEVSFILWSSCLHLTLWLIRVAWVVLAMFQWLKSHSFLPLWLVLAMYGPALGSCHGVTWELLCSELVTSSSTMSPGREWFKSLMLTPSTNHSPGLTGDGPMAGLAADHCATRGEAECRRLSTGHWAVAERKWHFVMWGERTRAVLACYQPRAVESSKREEVSFYQNQSFKPKIRSLGLNLKCVYFPDFEFFER